MSYNDGEDDLSQNDDDENTKEVDTDVLFPDFDIAEPACQSAIFLGYLTIIWSAATTCQKGDTMAFISHRIIIIEIM